MDFTPLLSEEPPTFWTKSKISRIVSRAITVLFLLYLLGIIIWYHSVYFTQTTTTTAVFPSARHPDYQHTFMLGCFDPLGCIVAPRRQNHTTDQDIINPPSDPSDPCNTFKTQFIQMTYKQVSKVAICYTADTDNGVAVLVHKGGNIVAFSAIDEDAKLTNEKDWSHTYGYQKMVSMIPIMTEYQISGYSYDDWLIELQEDLTFALTGDFFRCKTPADCGCNTFNKTDSNCEAFVFRLGEITYDYKIMRALTYMMVLTQIGVLGLVGYFLIKVINTVIVIAEKKKVIPFYSKMDKSTQQFSSEI